VTLIAGKVPPPFMTNGTMSREGFFKGNNFSISRQEPNQALRLKEEVIVANYQHYAATATGHRGEASPPTAPRAGYEKGSTTKSAVASTSAATATGIAWEYFDEQSYIAGDALKSGEDAYERNKFNQAASDRLASDRDVPDTRGAHCRARQWPAEALPDTSVIITFHNEARSALLRTVVR